MSSDADALRALAELYREVDAAHAGSHCDASTECCRFGILGREPYVTAIEVVGIERALARRGGALSARARALPLLKRAEEERPCPLLDVHGRCAVYADRPFGCRTFFCSRATLASVPRRSELKRFVQQLRDIAVAYRPAGDQPRPLSKVFRSVRRT